MTSRRIVLKGLGAAAAAGVLPRIAFAASQTVDVAVIGAGLSGLNAALQLESQGLKVAVLEARPRVGGRLYTLDDVPGHPEGGGNGIGAGYARMMDTAQKYGIKLIKVRPRTEASAAQTVLGLGGKLVSMEGWENSPANPFPDSMRKVAPWDFQVRAFAENNPLPDSAAWLDPAFAQYDRPVADALRERGISEAAIRLGISANPLYGTTAYDLSQIVWLHIVRWATEKASFGGASFAADGGNQRFPEAMAKQLKSPVRLSSPVRLVRHDANGVELVLADGSTVAAKRCIVSAPAPALRFIRFDPALDGPHSEAAETLGYTMAHQIHFVPTRRFWQEDGLPPNLWTDGPIGRFSPLHNDPADPDAVTTYLCFTSGDAAAFLDRMTPEAATQFVLDEVARLRPSTKGALKPVKVFSWQKELYSGATYSAWKPGQVTRFGREVSKPLGRLHFAGEHTAKLERGMEGAMESGERAALEVLEGM